MDDESKHNSKSTTMDQKRSKKKTTGRVRIDGQLLKTEWVISGVPQGSVLGPLLFLIMMLDIHEEILTTMIGSFADDTRLWQVIKADLDTNILQQQLQHMYSWAEQNNMHFNSGKFEHVRYEKSKQQAIHYNPFRTEIKQKACINDSGVFMSEDVKFDLHIKNTKWQQAIEWSDGPLQLSRQEAGIQC